MKSKILVAVIAAALAFTLPGCNAVNGQKQASQDTHKTAVDAAFGNMTSSRIKSN